MKKNDSSMDRSVCGTVDTSDVEKCKQSTDVSWTRRDWTVLEFVAVYRKSGKGGRTRLADREYEADGTILP